MNTTHTHDRYKIEIDGERVSVFVGQVRVICQRLDVYTVGAIRQQARDLEQLRGELAAAVAERDELREALDSIDGTLRSAGAAMGRAIERAEQAEARLAAIDGAPTVAIAVHTHTDRGPYKYLSYSELNVPRDGVELIARPAKDQA